MLEQPQRETVIGAFMRGQNILDFGLASSPSSKWGGTPETD